MKCVVRIVFRGCKRPKPPDRGTNRDAFPGRGRWFGQWRQMSTGANCQQNASDSSLRNPVVRSVNSFRFAQGVRLTELVTKTREESAPRGETRNIFEENHLRTQDMSKPARLQNEIRSTIPALLSTLATEWLAGRTDDE